MNFMYFSKNYSDILLTKHKLHLKPFVLLQSHLLLCQHGVCDCGFESKLAEAVWTLLCLFEGKYETLEF